MHARTQHGPRGPTAPSSLHAQALSTPPTRLRQRSTRRAPRAPLHPLRAMPTASRRRPPSRPGPRAPSPRCRGIRRSRCRRPTRACPFCRRWPLPLLTASFEAAPDDRTVQLGLAAASVWLCAAVVFAPRFTATAAARAPGLAHMAHSAAITYPAPLRAVAGVCMRARRCSAARPTRRRRTRSGIRSRRYGAE